jgi:regulator of nucleoside diphosphate kinase
MTTITVDDLWLSPNIILARTEHSQLSLLALAGTGHTADTADALLHELDRARIVTDPEVPPDVVRMGSTVRFRTGRDTRQVQLVYPADADISLGRISVLTPVGTALIGLRAGQSITFTARDHRPQMLTILAVLPPSGGDPGPMAA